MHKGTGRFTRFLMRPMSLYESGDSDGKVSLKDSIDGKDISASNEMSLDDIASVIIRGGGLQHYLLIFKTNIKLVRIM